MPHLLMPDHLLSKRFYAAINNLNVKLVRLISAIGLIVVVGACSQANEGWESIQSNHQVRHEAGMLEHHNKIVLLGGRGERAIEVFDTESQNWTAQITPSLEMHHFQPVSLNGEIFIVGALTGPWPEEDAIEKVFRYNTETQTMTASHIIPDDRARGAGGLVAYQGELYLLGGLTNGHMGGSVPWFDKYDPQSGKWTALPDAPRARDHFQAIVVDHKLYAIGGRQTSHATGEGMSLTQAQVDVYDFKTHSWSISPESANLSVPRAGNSAIAVGDKIVIAGGESPVQQKAHSEVDILDIQNNNWQSGPALLDGRHGTGFAVVNEHLYIVSGSGNAGGEPELDTMEKISLNALNLEQNSQASKLISFGQAIEVDVKGPEVSETDEINPFTDYLMQTEFRHESGTEVLVQGFFAADGKAAHTSADKGEIWRTIFTPQSKGKWQYNSKLYQAKDVVFAHKDQVALMQAIAQTSGSVEVGEPFPGADFFDRNGQVSLNKGYFYFPFTQQHWIKTGANSPENFLAYHEMDSTYRASQQAREGEAKAPDFIHEFSPHVQDYQSGDPLWQTNKGKGIIGAINYLASQGMQSQYFLTMNINGDGQDVWPYIDHQTLDRFDVSKLAQWDIVFSHLNDRNMLIHMVTQETENELFLDKGNTERLRKLYYRELIARFGYHNGLIWNLGEENGPSDWSPEGQSSEQRIAMAAYFEQNDPHNNPIFIHTMPSPHDKDNILPPLYKSAIEGMSFQIDNRLQAFDEIAKWRKLSAENGANKGHGWAITMDEIGMWHTGAKIDADDPTHDSLRRYALWGTLMAGATGVEWYFGAHQPHNDLSSEDFRQRENLWKQTKIAADFFNALPLTSLKPVVAANGLFEATGDGFHLVYYGAEQLNNAEINLSLPMGSFSMTWLDPITGEEVEGNELVTDGKNGVSIKVPESIIKQDAVLYLRGK
uniref:Kelch repeat-containing protein n=1 Tax=Ningiella ruwaisensis TaxID=2364274 RepID=UPI0010A025AE|nr:DUF5060 domain-containing protein [Ningiella ruwaisensis]